MARRAMDLSGMHASVRALGEQIGDQLGKVIAESVQRHLDSTIDVAKKLSSGSKRGRRPASGSKESCAEPGCNNPVLAKGMCRSHYYRARYQTQKDGPARGKRTAKPDAAAGKKKRARKAAKAPAEAAPEGETAAS